LDERDAVPDAEGEGDDDGEDLFGENLEEWVTHASPTRFLSNFLLGTTLRTNSLIATPMQASMMMKN